MKKLQKVARTSIAVFLVAGCLASAAAADRVYLRSGNDVVCDHQQTFNGQVRLYLTASDDNYLDVAADDIVRREAVQIDAEARPGTLAAETAAPTPFDLSVLLRRAGAEHHLDPDLLASVVRAESGGHARIISRAGARGLMQLMPATAAELGVRDSFAPEQNVAGGTTYLDALLMYYHDNLALALAAYNAGPAAVARYRGIPPYAETRRYVERVIHDYNQRKRREARQHVLGVAPASSLTAMVTRR